MTRIDDRPAPAAPSTAKPFPLRLPSFGFSVTSLVATALATITATFLASYLGVAGTVAGAAVASVTFAVVKEVYQKSLTTTGHRVREVVPVTRVLPRQFGSPTTAAPPPSFATESAAATDEANATSESAASNAPPEHPHPTPRRDRGGSQQAVTWRRIAISAVLVFIAVLAVITAVEVIGGKPVSDIVRGDSGSGTSFFGNTRVVTKTKTVPPVAPTVTVTVTPKVTFVTPTVTQTAPAVTQTNSVPPATGSSESSASVAPSTGTPTPSGSETP